MAKDFSIETKIKLCGLYSDNTASDKFNYSRFLQELVQPNPTIEAYAPLLFISGTHYNTIQTFIMCDNTQKKFQAQDKSYNIWVKLCEQVKFLLEYQSYDLFYAQHNQTQKHLFTLNDQRLFNIRLLDILVDDLCQFENDISNGNLTVSSDITLESINERLENARIEKDKILGINRGRPTSISVLHSHYIIQGLSCLLRIDKLIGLFDETKTINDIQLSKPDYELIFDFLFYFNLLAYEILDNTTTKADLIEQRLKKPPLKNHPQLDQYISVLHNSINHHCKELAILNKDS